VPVINGLTNEYHPCQILADIFTFIEHRGSIEGKTVAWIGDSNNVCNTWLQAAEMFGFNVQVSTPPGYEVEAERAGLLRHRPLREFADPMDAGAWRRPRDHGRVDLDGFRGGERRTRRRDFEDWQVDAEMMRAAKSDAVFMHCLPAHRGEEVAAAGHRRAAKRGVGRGGEPAAYAQKALMEFLLLVA
jgi:ornithine carbamoyltransferase